jgi:hypothetical protein
MQRLRLAQQVGELHGDALHCFADAEVAQTSVVAVSKRFCSSFRFSLFPVAACFRRLGREGVSA